MTAEDGQIAAPLVHVPHDDPDWCRTCGGTGGVTGYECGVCVGSGRQPFMPSSFAGLPVILCEQVPVDEVRFIPGSPDRFWAAMPSCPACVARSSDDDPSHICDLSGGPSNNTRSNKT